jgi:25S rRNA (uracil2634-N3)-methyltransferase
MGKSKRQKLNSSKSKKPKNNASKSAKPQGISKTKPIEKAPKQQKQHSEPTIPFLPNDRILLIGEGDLSFARSLVESHSCTRVTATVFESPKDLEEKYPHVEENIKIVEKLEEGAVQYGVDIMKAQPWMDFI